MILGYTRVSTEEQAADIKTSLEEQERVIRGLAMMKGVPATDIAMFSDPGVSAAMPLFDRPGGKSMLEAAKRGDVVVACKLDRMFRSARDALNTVETLKERGIGVILTDMGNDPVTANGTAKLFFTMLSAMAEWERMRILERITEGKRARMRHGRFPGGHAPYGFKVVGHRSEAVVVPDEMEQAHIAIIKKLAQEHTIREIVNILHDMGIKNRGGFKGKGRPTRKFQYVQVQRILKRDGRSYPSATVL